MTESKRAFAKHLRRNMTDAESLLWRQLRDRRLYGAKFKRQHPIGRYIVDFVCLEIKLVIEVDGGQHLGSEADRQRDDWLCNEGYRILRFWNNEVLQQMEAVLVRIGLELSPSPPPLSPVREGRCAAAGNPPAYSSRVQGRGDRKIELERVRWRCRRGMLELDIVLERFVETQYSALNESQCVAFDSLLDMPDALLWDMITGREPLPQSELKPVLEMIKAA